MKVEVHKKYRHGKTYVSGELEGVSFSTRDPSVEVDAIVYPKIDRALLMFTEAGDKGELLVQLNLTEAQVDHLRDVLYEVSKQMMVDRNKRELKEGHDRALREEMRAQVNSVSQAKAGYNKGEDNGENVMEPKLWSFKFKRNAYGDVGFNQIMAPSKEHAIEFAKDEFEGDHHGRAPLFVDENTFKEVKDVNAYYDSFPLMD
jgi:hypothetical protein|tara:strand:+ start:185 stop:790 length:606 start_codon:yes stop_codon:yes gene_type:complete